MKHTLFLFMMFSVGICFAQSDIVATGADGSSSGGTVSYSVGQVAYTSASAASGDINQGVQQPIEIFELTKSEFEYEFNATLFPNPAATAVTLSISSANENLNLEYQLTDITGKTIRNGKISSKDTTIDVQGFPQACYFVNVKTGTKIVRTFKLLKNNQ